MDTTQNQDANNFMITGDWGTQAKLLKEKFPLLTDTDLKLERGKDDELLTRIESRLMKKRDEVIRIIRKGQPENE